MWLRWRLHHSIVSRGWTPALLAMGWFRRFSMFKAIYRGVSNFGWYSDTVIPRLVIGLWLILPRASTAYWSSYSRLGATFNIRRFRRFQLVKFWFWWWQTLACLWLASKSFRQVSLVSHFVDKAKLEFPGVNAGQSFWHFLDNGINVALWQVTFCSFGDWFNWFNWLIMLHDPWLQQYCPSCEGRGYLELSISPPQLQVSPLSICNTFIEHCEQTWLILF